MAIKSNKVGSRKTITYPKLMKSTASRIILLMSSEREGVIVQSDETDEGYAIGTNSIGWNPDLLEDYTGKLTLRNT